MKNRFTSLAFLWLLSLPFFVSCNPNDQKQDEQPLIALSKAYDTYSNWLLAADSNLNFVNLYGMPVEQALKKLSEADGVLVTGGEDIHPGWYGRAEDTAVCNTINPYRDTLDAAIVKAAIREKIPLLGICRGMQIMNISLGGSLFADLPSQYSKEIAHRNPPFSDTLHDIIINQASVLHLIANTHSVAVVSNHHQGVRDLAPGLRKVAETTDALPEAVEWDRPAGKSFLLGVQFHPERNRKGALSQALASYFTIEARRYFQEKQSHTSENDAVR